MGREIRADQQAQDLLCLNRWWQSVRPSVASLPSQNMPSALVVFMTLALTSAAVSGAPRLLLLAAQLVQTEHKRVEPAASQVLATRTVLCGPLPASVRANSELPAHRPKRDATACLRASAYCVAR